MGSIQGRLILLVAGVVALAIAMGVLFLFDSARRQQAATERQLSGTSRALLLAVEGEIGKAQALVRGLAVSPNLAAGDLAGFAQQARAAMDGPDQWVVLKDEQGRQLVNTSAMPGAALPGPDPDFAPRWALLMAKGRNVSDLEWARLPRERVVKIEQIVRTRDGRAYDLGIVMRPKVLHSLLARQALPGNWYGGVIDRRLTIVSRSPEPERWLGQPVQATARERFTKGGDSGVFASVSLDGVKTLAAYNRSDLTGWVVAVAIPRYEAGGDLTRIGPVFSLGIVFLLAAGAGLTIWFARGVARDVRALTAYARALGEGGDPAEPATGLHEVDYVAVALKEATEGLQAREHELRRINETLEARVADATARLVQSQKIEAMGRLTGGVAHDFNNLLTAIVGNLELLKRRNVDPALERFVANAEAAAQRGASLTAQLLAFARRQRLNPEPIDLNLVVSDMGDLLQSTLGGAIRVEIDTGDAPAAMADRTQVEMVLLNLAINARDAMPTGGILRVRTNAEAVPIQRERPGSPPAGNHVVVIVEDTGSGMTPEVLERALEPFFSTKGVGHGSGLGLSQALGTMQQLGGGIELRSDNKGTAVKLYLPVASRAAAKAAPVAVADRDGTFSGLKVLLVDDDDAVRQVALDLLHALGCEVIEANGGEAALRLVEGEAVDVALLDYAMPGMTGLELANRLRAARPKLPIVITSGFAGAQDLCDGWSGPVLQKPYSRAHLVAALRGRLGDAKG